MDNKEFDKAFQEGLNSEKSFPTMEEDWALLHERLHPPKKRRRILWWPFLAAAVLFLGLTTWTYYQKSQELEAELARINYQNQSETKETSETNTNKDFQGPIETTNQQKAAQLSSDFSSGIAQEEFASQEVSNQRAQPKPPEQKATPESSTRDLNTTDNFLSQQRDIMDDLNSQTIILAEELKDKIDDTETLITETENASGPWENSIPILASLRGLDLLTFERDAPELGLLLTEEEEVEEDQP
ncbi:MAG: hypothetical protein HKN16_04205, partial [Saprospiraceae bacterium]|nr:hypothetical protein [Saprospiraceae bacterium]